MASIMSEIESLNGGNQATEEPIQGKPNRIQKRRNAAHQIQETEACRLCICHRSFQSLLVPYNGKIFCSSGKKFVRMVTCLIFNFITFSSDGNISCSFGVISNLSTNTKFHFSLVVQDIFFKLYHPY